MDIRTVMQLQVSRCIVIYHTLCMQSVNACMHIRACETISRASYLGRAIIEASELKHDCKRLNFAICGTEDHHERAWMIIERWTICGQGDHLWHHTWSGGPSMARKIATDGPGNQFLGDHRWHGSAPRNFIYTNI